MTFPFRLGTVSTTNASFYYSMYLGSPYRLLWFPTVDTNLAGTRRLAYNAKYVLPLACYSVILGITADPSTAG